MAMEFPRWGLEPSAQRVAAIDASLRARLAESLAYLAGVTSLADTHAATLAGIDARLKSGPVSPWVFGLYSKLVAELAGSPRGDVAGALFQSPKIGDDVLIVVEEAAPKREGHHEDRQNGDQTHTHTSPQ